MALPLFVLKLTAPVEVKLVLSALSEEAWRINNDPRRGSDASMGADIVAPKVTEDILGWSKQIREDIQNGRSPRTMVLYLMMNVAQNYLASGKFSIWAGIGIYRDGMKSSAPQRLGP